MCWEDVSLLEGKGKSVGMERISLREEKWLVKVEGKDVLEGRG